jgi:hypothetical protein
MVEMNVVLRDVSELVRPEIELRRGDVRAYRASIGGVAIDRPWPLIVAYGEHCAVHISFCVIERGEDDRGAELPFVDQFLASL